MSGAPIVTPDDTGCRKWDTQCHISSMTRYGCLAALLAFSTGFQAPTESVCFVGVDGEPETRVVTSAEAERLVAGAASYRGPCALYGAGAVLGEVMVRAFAQIEEDGTPYALGIRLPYSDLASLPTEAADGYRCLDLNNDDAIHVAEECVGGHERVLFLPREWEDRVDSPFRWALFNWNPMGHGPPGIWDVPHFDFHFFIQSLADRSRIRIGRCAMLVDCEDLELGRLEVPAMNLPEGYEDRGVVEFGMGNHLIDPRTFGTPAERPTHTLIYGAWAGRVSFLEPMITRAFLERVRTGVEPSGCHEIPQPASVQEPGYYPTVYCVRHRSSRSAFEVSIESFSWRSIGGGDA